MHGEPSIHERDDSVLLADWALAGRQEAFAELVGQYQRLVMGSALRRTGNVELARDVAQQVFATLASKARLLIGRQNIAGWLYHAASHFGARAALSERRRVAVHEKAVPSGDGSHEEEMWPVVEEAIASLGTVERDSIVLHYLQDLSYAEMASMLGIAEPTARKRVSRALQALEGRLRSRGVTRSAAAVLAGVVAQQGGVSASAGLAAGAVASSEAASIPVSLFLHTIMTHTTAKVAACAAAAILVPLALQWNANASLREQIAEARANPPPLVTGKVANPEQRLAALRAELAKKREAIMAAENEVVKLAELKRKVETEVVYSMGTVETMARQLAGIMKMQDEMEERQAALKEAIKKGPDSEEAKRAGAAMKEFARKAAEVLPQAMGLIREMVTMERSSEKAARFYATFLAEAQGLDDAARGQMEGRIRPWVERLQEEGLAFPQRPKGAGREDWNRRRMNETSGFLKTLSKEFPASVSSKTPMTEVFDGILQFIDMMPTDGGGR
jgi:RNA polymerase sigma factor (sigma-70 family)